MLGLQKMALIVFEKNCHTCLPGFICLGHCVVGEKDGDRLPVKGYFNMCVPSEDVISDNVKIFRYSLYLFIFCGVYSSLYLFSNVSMRNISFFFEMRASIGLYCDVTLYVF